MRIWKWLAAIALAANPAMAVPAALAPDKLAERMSESPEVALSRAMNGLIQKTQVHNETWRQGASKWSVDLDRGVIEFENDRGWHISAPVQVIGTYNTRDGTFLWGWDHPSVPSHAATAAKRVLEYGKRHKIKRMTTRMVSITEEQAWQYTALADYLTGGAGAYRGPTGHLLVFMTFGEITITKK